MGESELQTPDRRLYLKKTATIVSHDRIQPMITPLSDVKTVPLTFCS